MYWVVANFDVSNDHVCTFDEDHNLHNIIHTARICKTNASSSLLGRNK